MKTSGELMLGEGRGGRKERIGSERRDEGGEKRNMSQLTGEQRI